MMFAYAVLMYFAGVGVGIWIGRDMMKEEEV